MGNTPIAMCLQPHPRAPIVSRLFARAPVGATRGGTSRVALTITKKTHSSPVPMLGSLKVKASHRSLRWIQRLLFKATIHPSAPVEIEQESRFLMTTLKPCCHQELVSSSPSKLGFPFRRDSSLTIQSLVQTQSDDQLEHHVHVAFLQYGTCYVKIRRDARGMPFAFVQYEVSRRLAGISSHADTVRTKTMLSALSLTVGVCSSMVVHAVQRLPR